MLLASYLSVLGSGIEAGMSQVFLEQPESIAGVIKFGGMVAVAYSHSRLKWGLVASSRLLLR